MSHLFEEGKAPKGGRPKGARNKVTKEVREKLMNLLDKYEKKLQKELNKLEGEAFIDAYIDIAKTILPKENKLDVTHKEKQFKTLVIQSSKSLPQKNHTIEIGEIIPAISLELRSGEALKKEVGNDN